MINRPLVSILINNFNYGRFVEKAIDSALEQAYQTKEIIVVDDGSTDDSIDVINSYSDKAIIKIFKDNSGQASAFNAGFKSSAGDIICFLDSDDYFYKDKLHVILNCFQENDDIGWIFHSLKYVDEHEEAIAKTDARNQESKGEYVDFRDVFKKGTRFTHTVPCGLCFRREVLEQILPMPESSGVTISDNYIKYAALSLSPGLLLNEELAAQRIHGNNIYTFRSDKQTLRAKINVKTGFYLRENFPHILTMADKIFCRGCGEMISEGNISQLFQMAEYKQYMRKYLTPATTIQSLARTLWYTTKFTLNN